MHWLAIEGRNQFVQSVNKPKPKNKKNNFFKKGPKPKNKKDNFSKKSKKQKTNTNFQEKQKTHNQNTFSSWKNKKQKKTTSVCLFVLFFCFSWKVLFVFRKNYFLFCFSWKNIFCFVVFCFLFFLNKLFVLFFGFGFLFFVVLPCTKR